MIHLRDAIPPSRKQIPYRKYHRTHSLVLSNSSWNRSNTNNSCYCFYWEGPKYYVLLSQYDNNDIGMSLRIMSIG